MVVTFNIIFCIASKHCVNLFETLLLAVLAASETAQQLERIDQRVRCADFVGENLSVGRFVSENVAGRYIKRGLICEFWFQVDRGWKHRYIRLSNRYGLEKSLLYSENKIIGGLDTYSINNK